MVRSLDIASSIEFHVSELHHTAVCMLRAACRKIVIVDLSGGVRLHTRFMQKQKICLDMLLRVFGDGARI